MKWCFQGTCAGRKKLLYARVVIEYRAVLLYKMTSVIACALLSFLSEALSLFVFHKAARCAPIMLLVVAAFERC